MIIIDIKKLHNWDFIKEKQKDYLKTVLIRRLSKISYNLTNNNYEKYFSNNIVYSFNVNDMSDLEKLFNGKYDKQKTKNNFTFSFKDEKILELIAYGDIKDIINKFSPYSRLNKVFEWIFSYDSFSKTTNGWGRHELMKSMGTIVCPYCNRNYISGYYDVGKFRTTANIDHFYPQSNFPYLALSLLNFIPSCSICNSNIKLDKDFSDCIYPYNEGFEDLNAVFTIEGNGMGYLLDNSLDFNIAIKEKNNGNLPSNVRETIKKFKILQIYQSHKDIVQELLWKIEVYTDEQIEEIYQDFKDVFETNKVDILSNDRVKEIIFGVFLDSDQYEKRPLAKLLGDIYTEFKI